VVLSILATSWSAPATSGIRGPQHILSGGRYHDRNFYGMQCLGQAYDVVLNLEHVDVTNTSVQPDLAADEGEDCVVAGQRFVQRGFVRHVVYVAFEIPIR
jgi:hypothetical protein